MNEIDWSKPIVAYTDGGSRGNPGPSACAFAIYVGDFLVHSRAKFLGIQTNNYAEYYGVIEVLKSLYGLHYPAAPETLWRQPIRRVLIYCDSLLVVNQINGLWKINNSELKPLCDYATAFKMRGQHTLEHCDGHSGIVGNELCDTLVNEELDKWKAPEFKIG